MVRAILEMGMQREAAASLGLRAGCIYFPFQMRKQLKTQSHKHAVHQNQRVAHGGYLVLGDIQQHSWVEATHGCSLQCPCTP